MIEISKDYTLKSYGRFLDELAGPGQFKARLAELTNGFKNLATTYLNSLGGDAKITGLEKRGLIDALEEMLVTAVMLRRLDFAPEQEFVTIEKSNGLFRVELRFVDKSIWELSGGMLPEYKIKIGTFKDWLNLVLSDRLRNFLTEYGNAGLDKELSAEEKASIALCLDQVTIEVIEMIVFIERFMQFQ